MSELYKDTSAGTDIRMKREHSNVLGGVADGRLAADQARPDAERMRCRYRPRPAIDTCEPCEIELWRDEMGARPIPALLTHASSPVWVRGYSPPRLQVK